VRRLSRRSLRVPALLAGALAGVLYAASQQFPQHAELSNVGKIVAWTAMIFLPLFGLNSDLFAERLAQFGAIGMLGIHALIIRAIYTVLPSLNFVALAAIAIGEIFVLAFPLLAIRKRLDTRRRGLPPDR